jgi:hypothetical protein
MTVATAGMLTGCWNYVLKPETSPQMSVDEARKLVKSTWDSYWVISTTTGSILVREREKKDVTQRISLRDIDDIHVTGDLDCCHVSVRVGAKTVASKEICYGFSVWQKKANTYADAWFVLKQAAQSAAAKEQARFEEVARSNRGAAANPVLPEEARRFKVQAEGAVRDKQFENAEMYYGRVIEAAPWWAEGYFNRAVVLAELQDFDEAITEMKRYLLLAPNAPNARTVQDSIYEWERKVRPSN